MRGASVRRTVQAPNRRSKRTWRPWLEAMEPKVLLAVDLYIEKSGFPDQVRVDTNLVYTIQVVNRPFAGDEPAQNLLITDTVPAGVEVQLALSTPGWTYDVATRQARFTVASLERGNTTGPISLVVRPRIVGEIRNEVAVSSATQEISTSDNIAVAVTQVIPNEVDLSIVKIDDRDPVRVDDALTYTLAISNNGPGTATNVVVRDFLPAGVDWNPALSTPGLLHNPNENTLTLGLGNLAENEIRTVTVLVYPRASSVGTIANRANVSSDQPESYSFNNESVVTTVVQPVVDLQLVMTDNPDPLALCNLLTYDLAASNIGPNVATGVALRGQLPANTVFDVDQSSAGWILDPSSGQLSLPVRDLAPGESVTAKLVIKPLYGSIPNVTNAVTISAAEFDRNLANNQATTSTQIVLGPLPMVNTLERVGVHDAQAMLVVTYTQPMNPVLAANVAAYQLLDLGRDGKVGTRDDRVVTLNSATYDAKTLATTLVPAGPLALNRKYRITIQGQAVTNDCLVPLDGNGDGVPGGDYTRVFGKEILRKEANPPTNPTKPTSRKPIPTTRPGSPRATKPQVNTPVTKPRATVPTTAPRRVPPLARKPASGNR